jgi:hypothetical protein
MGATRLGDTPPDLQIRSLLGRRGTGTAWATGWGPGVRRHNRTSLPHAPRLRCSSTGASGTANLSPRQCRMPAGSSGSPSRDGTSSAVGRMIWLSPRWGGQSSGRGSTRLPPEVAARITGALRSLQRHVACPPPHPPPPHPTPPQAQQAVALRPSAGRTAPRSDSGRATTISYASRSLSSHPRYTTAATAALAPTTPPVCGGYVDLAWQRPMSRRSRTNPEANSNARGTTPETIAP